MTAKEQLHELVDELSEPEAKRALVLVKKEHDDPASAEFRDAPEDDDATALNAVEPERDSSPSRSEIDAAIVASYTQVPQEDLGAGWAAQQSILQEPWGPAT